MYRCCKHLWSNITTKLFFANYQVSFFVSLSCSGPVKFLDNSEQSTLLEINSQCFLSPKPSREKQLVSPVSNSFLASTPIRTVLCCQSGTTRADRHTSIRQRASVHLFVDPTLLNIVSKNLVNSVLLLTLLSTFALTQSRLVTSNRSLLRPEQPW